MTVMGVAIIQSNTLDKKYEKYLHIDQLQVKIGNQVAVIGCHEASILRLLQSNLIKETGS
jgi:hypothetical protein